MRRTLPESPAADPPRQSPRRGTEPAPAKSSITCSCISTRPRLPAGIGPNTALISGEASAQAKTLARMAAIAVADVLKKLRRFIAPLSNPPENRAGLRDTSARGGLSSGVIFSRGAFGVCLFRTAHAVSRILFYPVNFSDRRRWRQSQASHPNTHGRESPHSLKAHR